MAREGRSIRPVRNATAGLTEMGYAGGKIPALTIPIGLQQLYRAEIGIRHFTFRYPYPFTYARPRLSIYLPRTYSPTDSIYLQKIIDKYSFQ